MFIAMELRLSVTLVIISIRLILAKQLITPKCCSQGEILTKDRICIETNSSYSWVSVVRDDSGKLVNSDILKLEHRPLDCPVETSDRWFASTYDGEYYVRADGVLIIMSDLLPSTLEISPEKYCIDGVIETGKAKFDPLMCLENEKETIDLLRNASCLLVSCCFIFLTLAVYLYLPQLYTVHGRILVAYLTCLFVGFLHLAVMGFVVRSKKTTTDICIYMTIIIYFAMMSSFCWLNVMCYDIWRVFCGKRNLRPSKKSIRSQMFRYAIYCVSVPLILTIVVITMQFTGSSIKLWFPDIREEHCFLSDASRLRFMYIPLAIQWAVNILFFILTAVKIIRTRKETSILNAKENSRNDARNKYQTLVLHVKLFVIMGISWIMEVISSIYKDKHWVIFDIYNIFTGFFIFVIFVCKRDIFKALRDRYRKTNRSTTFQTEKSQTEMSKSSHNSSATNMDLEKTTKF